MIQSAHRVAHGSMPHCLKINIDHDMSMESSDGMDGELIFMILDTS